MGGARCELAACAAALAFLTGCSDPDERADVGFDDGYAVGYNTECQIRATLIEGDFENQAYAEAYARGRHEGAEACKRERSGAAE